MLENMSFDERRAEMARRMTRRVTQHLGAGVDEGPNEGPTPSERFINAIFGVAKTPEQLAAAAAEKAAAAAAEKAASDAARLRVAQERAEKLVMEMAAEDAPAIARVAMVNAAIAALVAEGVLCDHDHGTAPHVWGLRWSERKRRVDDESNHCRSEEAWALYATLKAEGISSPDRAADILAEICGLIED